jgi:hypothetical protein
MKTLITIALAILFIGCATIYKNDDIKVIRYQKFGKYVNDWYDHYEPRQGYMMYYKALVGGTRTNYIHGDYEVMSYEDYQRKTRFSK